MYRVIWRRRLIDAMHTFAFMTHERGGDVEGLARSVESVDRRLSHDPNEAGESRAGNERVLILHPITVYFEVFEESKIVLIYSVVRNPRFRA